MCGNGVSPKSFQHGGPLKQHHALTSISWNLIYPPSLEAALANGTSFGARAIVPARNKCGHLRQASSYPLGDVVVPEKSNSEHLMRATGSSLGGPASGPPFYTVASRGRRRLRRIVRRPCMRTEVQITGRGDRDLSHDVNLMSLDRTILRACSLNVSLRQNRKVKGHLKSRRAGGTDADDGCGEGTGAYPGTVPFGMTSPSSLVDVVRSKGQHPMAHLLDMGLLFSTSLSSHV
ncbi:hypothetical protein ALC57_01500 [Trachymyrmex cornetzi]|uniref:Uncharacterized protein n=1 Tax=Trachymyrmex cornetzi TaxID=471704 RepID=A0A151JPQ5_9HYME|nr:hypothetical protein ALC57_01500 [Trachymyrmex cornetzi]